MAKLWRRLWCLMHRARLERELAEEMEAHRAMMPPEQRARFGSPLRLREEAREAWSWAWLDQFAQDLAYGARMLARAPGFTLGAMLILGLGVGVNLAEFQIFDGMVFHRYHFRGADTFLQFRHVTRRRPELGFPAGAVEFYRAHSRSFVWLVAEDPSVTAILEGVPDVRMKLVSPDYFSNLGLVPAWGRLLDARDSQPGAPPAAVLGYQYWQTHFGGDPHVIGRVVHVGTQPVEVVGVAPYTFDGFYGRSELWLPLAARTLLLAGAPPLATDFARPSQALFGQLKPGVTPAAAEGELTALTHELARFQPRAFAQEDRVRGQLAEGGFSARFLSGPMIIFIIMLLLVLFSACANLGNMLLARGLARQREIQIRMAIGAGPGRVVRQLVTESLLVAVLGGITGIAFGAACVRILMALLNAAPGITVPVRWPVVAAGLTLALLSVLLFGLPAALRAVSPQRKAHMRQSLIGVQVAVSCLLLIASAVLAHNGMANASVELSFDYRNMVIVYPQLYALNLSPAAAQERLHTLAERIAALPGVDGVAASVAPPLGSRTSIDHVPGLPPVSRNTVGASYFTVMNLPIVRGGLFPEDIPGAAIVSESAARAIWPGQDPIGKTLTLAGAARTVVGVVKDSGANLLVDPDSVEAYLPQQGSDFERSGLILHTRGDPAAVARLLPSAAASAGETVSTFLMTGWYDSFFASLRRLTLLIGSIGVVATGLAAAGMFAMVAFTLAQRRRELGIRMAIGARPRHILHVLLGQSARPTAIGAAAGAVLAAILARLVRSVVVLQSNAAVDILGFAAGLAAFAVVALLATISPARCALRIDPAQTLREE